MVVKGRVSTAHIEEIHEIKCCRHHATLHRADSKSSVGVMASNLNSEVSVSDCHYCLVFVVSGTDLLKSLESPR